MTRSVYFDCDTGVDDALALAYLLASPEVELVGIGTVSGNVSAGQAAENTLRRLALAGRSDVPVAVGEHDPLVGRFNGGAPHVHGANGLGGVQLPESPVAPVDEHAADMLVRLSLEHEGRLEVIAVGPLTNLARALERDPELPARITHLTIMGGAALAPGNISPVAEANIGHDAEAAHAVIDASWPITLVPLDATMENVLEDEDRQRMADSGSALVSSLGRMLDHYFDFYVAEYGRRCSALHDPLAAVIAVGGVQAEIAPTVPVEIDATDGPGRGQTICDLRGQRCGAVDRPGAHVRVVLRSEGQLAPHLVERLLHGASARTGGA